MSDAPAPSSAESSESLRRRRVVLTLVVFSLGLALDLVSKSWAWNNLRYPGQPYMVIDPVFELAYSFNTGSAFGMLTGVSWARTFFIGVTALALAYMVWLTMRMPADRALGFVAVGLVASGAAGNLHDRLVRADALGRHGVVDFIKVNYPWGGSWPTFNVADVLLLAGVVLLFFFLPRGDDDESKADDAAEADDAKPSESKADDESKARDAEAGDAEPGDAEPDDASESA